MTPTIKSLAAELGVSEQALRSWCKRNEIEKTTKGKITSYVITEEVAEQIKNHYAKQHNESESKPQRKHNENDTTKAYIDSLLKQIEDLKADKAELKANIKSLTAERQATLAKLFTTLEKNEALQLELNEYKTTADKKETVVEVSTKQEQPQQTPTETEQEQQPTKQPAEDPPKKKLSFFQRLFRRK